MICPEGSTSPPGCTRLHFPVSSNLTPVLICFFLPMLRNGKVWREQVMFLLSGFLALYCLHIYHVPLKIPIGEASITLIKCWQSWGLDWLPALLWWQTPFFSEVLFFPICPLSGLQTLSRTKTRAAVAALVDCWKSLLGGTKAVFNLWKRREGNARESEIGCSLCK